MINSEEKLELLKSSVLSEVQRKSEKIIAGAKQEKAKIILDISDKHYVTAEKEIESGKSAIAGKYAKQSQSQRIRARKDILMHRRELVEKIFSGVEKRLRDFVQSPEYADFLRRAVVGCEAQISEIRLSGADYERRGELLGELAESYTVSRDDAVFLGGVRLVPKSGGMVYDLSFDTALEIERERFSDSFDLKLE